MISIYPSPKPSWLNPQRAVRITHAIQPPFSKSGWNVETQKKKKKKNRTFPHPLPPSVPPPPQNVTFDQRTATHGGFSRQMGNSIGQYKDSRIRPPRLIYSHLNKGCSSTVRSGLVKLAFEVIECPVVNIMVCLRVEYSEMIYNALLPPLPGCVTASGDMLLFPCWLFTFFGFISGNSCVSVRLYNRINCRFWSCETLLFTATTPIYPNTRALSFSSS